MPTVRDVLSSKGESLHSIDGQASVLEATRRMNLHKVGALVVMESGRVTGIFTERDALLKLGERANELAEQPISEFMTRKVESLPPTAKIAFAVHRMDHGGYRHVPVVNDKGESVGIFSVRDILSYLTRKLAAAK